METSVWIGDMERHLQTRLPYVDPAGYLVLPQGRANDKLFDALLWELEPCDACGCSYGNHRAIAPSTLSQFVCQWAQEITQRILLGKASPGDLEVDVKRSMLGYTLAMIAKKTKCVADVMRVALIEYVCCDIDVNERTFSSLVLGLLDRCWTAGGEQSQADYVWTQGDPSHHYIPKRPPAWHYHNDSKPAGGGDYTAHEDDDDTVKKIKALWDGCYERVRSVHEYNRANARSCSTMMLNHTGRTIQATGEWMALEQPPPFAPNNTNAAAAAATDGVSQ